MAGVFLFRVLADRLGIGRPWNNNKPLRGCSQAKILPSRPSSLSHSSRLSCTPPSAPWLSRHTECVSWRYLLTRPKQLGYIIITEKHSNIRLGRFLESVQHVSPSLIQREDCSERGLAMLSFHVIAGHIRTMFPGWWTWTNSFNLGPLGCCRDSEMRDKWDPDLNLTAGGGNRVSVEAVCESPTRTNSTLSFFRWAVPGWFFF